MSPATTPRAMSGTRQRGSRRNELKSLITVFFDEQIPRGECSCRVSRDK
jgi:hypothetical protein